MFDQKEDKKIFKECPSCEKKGFYLPRATVSHKMIIYHNKTCKYCGYIEGGTTIRDEEYL